MQAPVEDYYFTSARFVAAKTASTSRASSFAAGTATGILAAGVVLLIGVLVVRSRRPDAPPDAAGPG